MVDIGRWPYPVSFDEQMMKNPNFESEAPKLPVGDPRCWLGGVAKPLVQREEGDPTRQSHDDPMSCGYTYSWGYSLYL